LAGGFSHPAVEFLSILAENAAWQSVAHKWFKKKLNLHLQLINEVKCGLQYISNQFKRAGFL